MSQSDGHSRSPSSTSSQTTNAPEHKQNLECTTNSSSKEIFTGLDFLKIPEDELFGNPDDSSGEIQGSLERLERLLQPVEDGLDSAFELFKPPRETSKVSLHGGTHCGNTSNKTDATENATKTNASPNGRLVQSVETITHLSLTEFMDLLERYAFYLTDDRFEFDRFTGEPVLTSNAVDISSLWKNEGAVKEIVSCRDDDRLVTQEATTTLIVAQSTYPPSEGLISIPEGEEFSVESKGHTVHPSEKGISAAFKIKEPCSGHTKRKRGSDALSPSESWSTGHRKTLRTTVKRGNTADARRMKNDTDTNPLSTDFIAYRFGITPAHNGSERWECPFAPQDALKGGKCRTTFDAAGIRSHVHDHIDAHTREHPLECPYSKTGKGCTWKATVSSNTNLPRHIAEVHLRVNAHRCSCGTYFARGTRDQFVRHLRDGHEKKLQEKRKTDLTLPEYISVDDPRLVDEERRWLRSTGRLAEEEEDDRGEGSSIGVTVKRARRF
ncbi:hypothetical protein ACEPAH_7453 [Sanghuangporus vaninii]